MDLKNLNTLIEESRSQGQVSPELAARLLDITRHYIDRPSFKRLTFTHVMREAAMKDLLDSVLAFEGNYFAQCIHVIRTACFRVSFQKATGNV